MEMEKEKRVQMFEILAFPTLLYAIVYTFLLYDNWGSVTMPLFVAATAVYVYYVLKQMGISGKKGGRWYVLMMFLLGISDMFTANTVIQTLNNLGIFLLLVCMLLSDCFEVRSWRLGTYVRGIFHAVVGATANLAEPFFDGAVYFSADHPGKKNGKALSILIGAAAAIPFLVVVTSLLYSADVVFAQFLLEGLKLNLSSVFGIIMFFGFAFLSAYCGMRYLEKRTMKTEEKTDRSWEPVIAITAVLPVSVIYMIFCGIQVIYLFLRNMDLPDGYTYAAYAREGFFQLLFVSMINLVLVLFVQSFFREHSLLKMLLTLICVCTYVMIASSALRMVLYIQAYRLTFLRVLVLWALVLLAVLLAGVLVRIWQKQFPLFSYGQICICVCYLILSFGHVDYFIAKYNLGRTEEEMISVQETGTTDYDYLSGLSADAAPAIHQAMKDGRIDTASFASAEERTNSWLYSYVYLLNLETTDSWRQFNVSHAYARSLFSEEIEKQ